MRPSLTVIKVGGSLLDWPGLPGRLTEFLDGRRTSKPAERLALIAGGGPAADLIRTLDRIHGLGDQTAHVLALHALDLTAIVLAAIVPGSQAVDRIEALTGAWDAGVVPILAPRPFLSVIDQPGSGSGLDPLPASWDVTSDSIAARIAVYLEADALIMLKSASLPPGASRDIDTAARLGFVDPTFPAAARAMPRVAYLNLREPAAELEDLPR
jgi:5-(aminomethyl)-3-furanmethanol phosphate kinase